MHAGPALHQLSHYLRQPVLWEYFPAALPWFPEVKDGGKEEKALAFPCSLISGSSCFLLQLKPQPPSLKAAASLDPVTLLPTSPTDVGPAVAPQNPSMSLNHNSL